LQTTLRIIGKAIFLPHRAGNGMEFLADIF
jgi:hypothetical protein